MTKAIFFDIDGTLVSFNTHKVAPSSIDALQQLRKKGIKTFIATGRHPLAINMLGDLEFDGYVTINGGLCFAGKDRVIYERAIEKEDMRTVINYMETKKNFPVIIVQKDECFITYFDERVNEILRLLNFPAPPVKPLHDALKSDVFQVIAFMNDETEQDIIAHLPRCETTRWHPLFTDIVPLGSSKDIGIDKVIAHFGIDISETMAFGDGGNDITMLQHVGTGIAMSNADDEVKAVADYITTSVDDDGIYNALKHFGLV